MPLSRDEAAEALKDIERAEQRSFSFQGYRAAAPQLILWGVIWMAGYGGTYLIPAHAGGLWAVLSLGGAAASTLIGMYSKPGGRARFSWRIFFTWLASLAMLSSILAIFAPIGGKQVGTLFPLVIGWAYVGLGIWMGWRFCIAGIAIVALTLFGFFSLTASLFALWMAGLGGAVLVGSGLWLRSA